MAFGFQHMRRDALTACALAGMLGCAWAARDWSALSALRLPDTDDGMRLQQIRDWLGGQRFADLTQYRLGAGVPMHWSRLVDLVPGGSIALLTPLVGRDSAELATVTAWPIGLFLVALLLIGRITRALGGGPIAATACIVAAIAYPATTIFLPGRIDHHGLQVVLLLGATLATLGRASVARGSALGLLAALTLTIGMETIPLFVVLGAVALGEWIATGARGRLLGLGAGAVMGLIISRLLFATDAWAYPACDGFTAQAWTAATIASLAPLPIALASPFLQGVRPRALMAVVTCGLLATIAMLTAPGCASPYGAVDPLLVRLWLSQVGEAQSVASAPTATTIGYCGVMVVGVFATLAQVAMTRSRGWIMMAALQAGALAIAMVQLRGAYAGTMLAAPALAAMIAQARERGTLALAIAWLVSAGMLYPIAGKALLPPPADAADQSACSTPAVIAALARLPAGMVMAPIDVGGFGIPATPHRFVAGPYHRNTAGNLAMFDYYRGAPDAAGRIAANWHVNYVLACPGMPGEQARGTMATRLRSSVADLRVIARPAPGVTLFMIDR